MKSEAALAVTGLRVLALEQAVAAPLCSRHLADLGATVIKIERPDGGDFARRYDSVVLGQSAYFVWLNRGKKSVVLDLRTAEGREAFDRLLEDTDVFLHNLGPGAVDRLGYGQEAVEKRWPALITCAISGYGQDGPYRDNKAFDLLLQGESGLLSVTGGPESPARVGISIADISAGMYALAGILAALIERHRTGRGRWLDIAMLDCLAEWMSVPALYQIYRGTPPARTGLHHPTIAPYGPYPTAEGKLLLLAVQNEGQWARLCEQVLREPKMIRDPRFDTNEARVEHRAELDEIIAAILGGQPRDQVIARLDVADVPFGAINSVAEFVEHPQLIARDRWVEVETPAGPIRAVRPPFGLRTAVRAVPALGASTAEVLGSDHPPREAAK